MKHRELILAALDGKTIQWAHPYPKTNGKIPAERWNDFTSSSRAVCHLADVGDRMENLHEYRIKPEQVPDQVRYGAIYRPDKPTVGEYIPESPADWAKGCRQCAMVPVRLTLKTDENGVVTEHVEIVK